MHAPDALPAAIVLGAAVWATGPSPTLRRRALHGARLVLSGEAGLIVGTGGTGLHPPAEGALVADLARAAGVPEAAIRAETASRTTWENIALARPLLPGPRVLVVTDAWHMPRAMMIARRLGLAPCAAPCPPGAHRRQRLRLALREVPAYAKDRLRPV